MNMPLCVCVVMTVIPRSCRVSEIIFMPTIASASPQEASLETGRLCVYRCVMYISSGVSTAIRADVSPAAGLQ